MNDAIFLNLGGGKLARMNAAKYDKEIDLQLLIENYPDLLAGDQIDSDVPRNFLHVAREFPVSDGETDHWRLDQLFVDQDGIPTLVEVKRSGDPRIRREVVAQMLDYAANAVAYLPVPRIREMFRATCDARQQDAESVLATFTGDSGRWWGQVEEKLKAGHVRLLFVADQFPRETLRIIQFLNEQMNPAEVLALEIKQYRNDDGHQILVPRLQGVTVQSQQRKVSSFRRGKISEVEFVEQLREDLDTETFSVAGKIIEWCRSNGLIFNFNRNQESVSFIPYWESENGTKLYLFSLDSHSTLRLQTGHLFRYAPFETEEAQQDYLQQAKLITSYKPGQNHKAYPGIVLPSLTNETKLNELFRFLTWLITRLK